MHTLNESFECISFSSGTPVQITESIPLAVQSPQEMVEHSSPKQDNLLKQAGPSQDGERTLRWKELLRDLIDDDNDEMDVSKRQLEILIFILAKEWTFSFRICRLPLRLS